jgi:hypothetical protein
MAADRLDDGVTQTSQNAGTDAPKDTWPVCLIDI